MKKRSFLKGIVSLTVIASTNGLSMNASYPFIGEIPKNEIVEDELIKELIKVIEFYKFEINDELTRSNIKSHLYKILNSYKHSRKYEFKTIVDETNNSPEIIDNGNLIANVYIKRNKSLNFQNIEFKI